MWQLWWVWVAGGVAIGILELFAPGYIFVGFALGAIATGGLIAAGVLGTSLPVTLLAFALLSVLAWVGARGLMGKREGQVKRIDHDINEN
ncbi:MAG: hypothetical protein WCZ72_12040 [Gemmobacter sp.]